MVTLEINALLDRPGVRKQLIKHPLDWMDSYGRIMNRYGKLSSFKLFQNKKGIWMWECEYRVTVANMMLLQHLSRDLTERNLKQVIPTSWNMHCNMQKLPVAFTGKCYIPVVIDRLQINIKDDGSYTLTKSSL